jgi:predicted kinase
MKLIFTKGLPASGKSTWAKEFCTKNPDWIRVSRDDLRNMRGKYWIPKQERLITKIEDACIIEALRAGKNVIIDATNLNDDRTKARVSKLREEFYLSYEIKFFDIDVKEAIKRDLTRTASVGSKVIQGMYDKNLAPAPVVYSENKDLPKAIVVDIDGTLAKMTTRGPFDWMRVKEDSPKKNIISLAQMYKANGFKLIIFTGRDGCCLGLTEEWLMDNQVPYDEIYIRPEGDQRKDSIIKKELFENHIRGRYNIELIVDDRDQVVEMWRKELGLTCLQVDYGNF